MPSLNSLAQTFSWFMPAAAALAKYSSMTSFEAGAITFMLFAAFSASSGAVFTERSKASSLM